MQAKIVHKMQNDRILLNAIQREQLQLLDFNNNDLTSSQVSNFNGDMFTLSDSLKTNRTLILCISVYNCKNCVDFVLQNVNVINEKIGHDKLLIIADKYIHKDIFIFAKANNVSNKFYFITNDCSLRKTLENVNMPIAFVVDGALKNEVSHVFIPHAESPTCFGEYITIVTQYINENCD